MVPTDRPPSKPFPPNIRDHLIKTAVRRHKSSYLVYSPPSAARPGTAGSALWISASYAAHRQADYAFDGRVAGARFDFPRTRERLIVLSLYVPDCGHDNLQKELHDLTEYLTEKVAPDIHEPDWQTHLLVLGDMNSTYSPRNDRITGGNRRTETTPPNSYAEIWTLFRETWGLCDTGTPGDFTHVSRHADFLDDQGHRPLLDAARIDYALASPLSRPDH
eukprot:tig00020849_g14656.t1